jgi:transcriptional regulator with XRE-family HTH domain
MDRSLTADTFRQRLRDTLERTRISQSDLAGRISVDRSTLSQLMNSQANRLPRADTVGAIATTLGVSLDWLMGLTQDDRLSAEILERSMQVQHRDRSPMDEDLIRWHQEAAGYRIRYVPSNLPDQITTEAVIHHEHGVQAPLDQDQALTRARDRLDYSRRPETDIEICMPTHRLRSFARGEGLWQGLSASDREEQILHIANLANELYPSMRIFLYDERVIHSAPITVFGPLRAAIYVGQMYFVFNTTQHIRVLNRHFDTLIRGAEVQPHQVSEHVARLVEEIV